MATHIKPAQSTQVEAAPSLDEVGKAYITWLEEASKLKIVIQEPDLLCSNQECCVIWQLAGEIVNCVGLSCSGWPIKEEALLDGQAELPEPLTLADKVPDIPIEKL